MALIKVYSEKQNRSNVKTSVFVPSGKKILVWDKDCTTEVEESLLIELLQVDPSIKIFDKEVEEKILNSQITPEQVAELQMENKILKEKVESLESKNELLHEQITSLSNELAGKDDEEVQFSKEDFMKMKIGEMQEVAKEAKLPEEQWKDFTTKKPFVEYLFDKLKQS